MNEFSAGFARVNITPAMGTPIAGYYHVRLADGVLDELEAQALALSLGESRLLLLSVDHLGLPQSYVTPLRQAIAERTGVSAEAVFIACTHTHTAPAVQRDIDPALEAVYEAFLRARLIDAACFALKDLKPARMGWGVGQAPGIAFPRRFRMRDGSIRTNPGVDNPEIEAPIGQADERVGVLRFDREGGETVVLAHFGVHPDTVGGCAVSADWPGFARRTLERVLPHARCLVLNGVQGDINHVNVHPSPGDLNDLTMDFDDVMRGYGHARHMGRTVAGAVLQVFDKVRYTPVRSLCAAQRILRQAANLPRSEELPLARQYVALHQAHRDAEIPYQGMQLTTVIAEAERMLQLEHGPEHFDLCLSALAIGDVALLGLPGEPFSGIGRALRTAPDWAMVLPCCCANGYEGYFPDLEAYQCGGYEVRSSIFAPGVAEAIIHEGLDMLALIEQNRRLKQHVE